MFRSFSVDGKHGVMTAKRMLLAAWFVFGVAPFVLQTRSFLKFATPHKITERLLVPPGVEKETSNMTQHCVAEGMQMAQIWWNIYFTHYYFIGEDVLCHFVVPQYNVHGNFMIGKGKVEPFPSTPSNCANDSYPTQTYFYHGSIGFYSFYEEVTGTYCAKDFTYGLAGGLGTFEMNGSRKAVFCCIYDKF